MFMPVLPAMSTVYFDIHNDASITIDDEGVDLPNTCAARQMALELLGQTILDGARDGISARPRSNCAIRMGPFCASQQL